MCYIFVYFIMYPGRNCSGSSRVAAAAGRIPLQAAVGDHNGTNTRPQASQRLPHARLPRLSQSSQAASLPARLADYPHGDQQCHIKVAAGTRTAARFQIPRHARRLL